MQFLHGQSTAMAYSSTTIESIGYARNIEKVIIGAYRWLSDHYQPGDEIFLFGIRLSNLAIYVLIFLGSLQASLVEHTKFEH